MVSAVRDFSGRMILPLLALGGIAFGLKYYGFWGKRPARKVVMLMEKEKDNNSTDQIEILKAGIGPLEVKYFQRETEIFRNLRTLHLVLVDTNDFDIVKISPILRFCPLLQYLILDIKMTRCSADIPDSPLIISPTCHTELKEAGFRGFHGTTAEIEFALYILRSAMVLERLILSQRVRCYSGFGKWENTFVSFDETRQSSIQRQLHGQAISTKAVVAFV
ncbi:PREDICTED: uncharacterized protein LOC109211321 isoform X2 [Nicotiana attenuata]|uniref:uncharacterized protein LOC109211321 isoform X2 n=1 Tax=Nicotiana attenuata TaxID=49451 RepID=UPI00090565DF|nr:PREDICTED: uncharacterized protein LOC109211321 isoform X2 [Nicotiana attenuata]